jgi:hypothetical protein
MSSAWVANLASTVVPKSWPYAVHALADTQTLWKEHGPDSDLRRASLAGYRAIGLSARTIALLRVKALLKGSLASSGAVRSIALLKMPAIFSAEGKSCFELTPRSLIGSQIEPILLFPQGWHARRIITRWHPRCWL